MKILNVLRIAPLLIFLALMLAVANGFFIPKGESGRTSAMIGRQVPEFALPLLQRPGDMFLTSQWQGQVAVINIFASWCVPCKAEHPLLSQLALTPGINLFGIAWKDSDVNIAGYLTQSGNPFRSVGMDSRGTTTLLFGITGLPETYVIDKKNIVRFKYAGPLTADVINQKLLPLVQQLHAEP